MAKGDRKFWKYHHVDHGVCIPTGLLQVLQLNTNRCVTFPIGKTRHPIFTAASLNDTGRKQTLSEIFFPRDLMHDCIKGDCRKALKGSGIGLDLDISCFAVCRLSR